MNLSLAWERQSYRDPTMVLLNNVELRRLLEIKAFACLNSRSELDFFSSSSSQHRVDHGNLCGRISSRSHDL
jgi:hypothetical protein